MVMNMHYEMDMLDSILKNAQIGQLEIRSVLSSPMRPTLRSALESQLKELNSIEAEAWLIASRRGWEMADLEPATKLISYLKTRAKLMGGNTDSKIADMMIRGNTNGMIACLKNHHQFNRQDFQIHHLSQKLLDCETANIRQMQTFL